MKRSVITSSRLSFRAEDLCHFTKAAAIWENLSIPEHEAKASIH